MHKQELDFAGPKTLEEIKREKERRKSRAQHSGHGPGIDTETTEEGEISEQDVNGVRLGGETRQEDLHENAGRSSSLDIPTTPTTGTPVNSIKRGKGKSKWESEEESEPEERRERKRSKKLDRLTSEVPSEISTPDRKRPRDSTAEPSPKRQRTASLAPTPIGSPKGTPIRQSSSAAQRTGDGTSSRASVERGTTPIEEDQRMQLEPTPQPTRPPGTTLSGPPLVSCRSVDNYEKLNRIEEGAYGVVYRARDRQTGEIVALKKLKLENEKNGFPVTSLREIHTLLLAKHPNIVNVKEIVVTSSMKGIFIVMEFVEHDLKSLMESMPSPFLQSEIKTLMMQLLSAVACLHQNWIVHRDLKTSNLLMNNRGEMKVADFGLARRFGSPLGHMTQLVVTLWYRAPELLLGAKKYTTAIDMWSIGCIFGELVNKEPLMPGRGEFDQLKKMFNLIGTPTERIWPGLADLPGYKTFNFVNQPYNNLRSRFPYLTENGLDLMSKLLTYDPEKRITAEEALRHPYFRENPLPKDPSLFPTFPSKGAGEKRKVYDSPKAPSAIHGLAADADDGPGLFAALDAQPAPSFRLNF